MKGKHIVICGAKGIGKSTLVKRLLEHNTRTVYGYITKSLPPEPNGFHPIYIHAAGSAERTCNDANLIGTCDRRTHNVNLDVFNTLGVEYLRSKPDGLIVMDELGFMESEAVDFVSAVFDALDRDIPVLAAAKNRFDVEFLNRVRAHKNVQVYMIDAENRDRLFDELLPVIETWNAER